MKAKATFYVEVEVLERFRRKVFDIGTKNYSQVVETLMKDFTEKPKINTMLIYDLMKKLPGNSAFELQNLLILYYPDVAIDIYKIDKTAFDLELARTDLSPGEFIHINKISPAPKPKINKNLVLLMYPKLLQSF